jgi:hypothetical protein
MRSAGILALTGGGIMARFTTRVLEDLQSQRIQMTGADSPAAPLSRAFDMMAGTSAGALCVAGLAVGRSPAELSRFFDAYGSRIFPPDWWRKGRWLLTSKYRSGPLQDAVDVALDGNNPRLGEIAVRVVFPAIDENAGQPVIFTNADPRYDELRLRDVVLASAAAPTYFPAHRIEALGRRYVDGGLCANAPDLAALTIALRTWDHLKLQDIHVLSIGTTSSSSQSPHPPQHAGAKGLIAWMSRPLGRIMKVTMRCQVDHAVALLDQLDLGDFIRINARLDCAGGKAMDIDNASVEALSALTAAGAGAIAALSVKERRRLAMIVGRNRSRETE